MTDWREWRSRCRRMALKSGVSCRRTRPGKQWRGNRPGLCRRLPKQGGPVALHQDRSDRPERAFSLEGLVPAEYRICALTDHEPGRESELDYLSSLERDSERIDLSPGQTVEESLVALPAGEVY